MAEQTWKEQMTIVVRSLINDLDNIKYDDGRIQQMIVVGAQLIKMEVDFLLTYSMNLAQITITPDPVDNFDDGFITLVSLKTAVLILLGELKSVAAGAVRVQDASAQIDMTGAYTATKDLYDKILHDYEKAKMQFVLGNLSTLKAILTPYTIPYNQVYPHVNFG